MNLSNKTIYLIIGILIILMFLIGLIYVTQAGKIRENANQISPTPAGPVQSPTPINVKSVYSSRKLNTVPTLNPTSGYGLDLNSPEIVSSKNEIKKISDILPYKKIITTNGIKTDIFIPPATLLENEWTLSVDIYGIDYEIGENDPDYLKNKQAFIAAAQDIYFWLKSNGVATENIIIQWGDRAYIQDKSEQWLQ
jgi:hypothetical protein